MRIDKNDGYRHLAAAVVTQSINDAKDLISKGIQICPLKKPRTTHRYFNTKPAEETEMLFPDKLYEFFKNGGLEAFLDIADLDVNADDIRRKVNVT